MAGDSAGAQRQAPTGHRRRNATATIQGAFMPNGGRGASQPTTGTGGFWASPCRVAATPACGSRGYPRGLSPPAPPRGEGGRKGDRPPPVVGSFAQAGASLPPAAGTPHREAPRPGWKPDANERGHSMPPERALAASRGRAGSPRRLLAYCGEMSDRARRGRRDGSASLLQAAAR